MLKVAINGYGRIGRITHRIIEDKFSDKITIFAINAGSSTDLKGWMHLLKYDSVYGVFPHELSIEEVKDDSRPDYLGKIILDGRDIQVYSQKDPSKLPWGDLEIDVVIESTGKLLTEEKAQGHLVSGAKKVILSAPAKDDSVSTYVLSINEDSYKGEKIISNASCTTNCISPVVKVISDKFGIQKALMTTIHAYTSDQKLHDGGHKDYRRARAAGINMIPTSTGATKAAALVIPELKDNFSGLSIRVPVPVGSISDFSILVSKKTDKKAINDVLIEASDSARYKNILGVTSDPIVSTDIIGSTYSSIVDLSLTQVVGGDLVKIIAWYDNEYGYSYRLVEMALKMSEV